MLQASTPRVIIFQEGERLRQRSGLHYFVLELRWKLGQRVEVRERVVFVLRLGSKWNRLKDATSFDKESWHVYSGGSDTPRIWSHFCSQLRCVLERDNCSSDGSLSSRFGGQRPTGDNLCSDGLPYKNNRGISPSFRNPLLES